MFVEGGLPDMDARWMGQFRMCIQERMPLAQWLMSWHGLGSSLHAAPTRFVLCRLKPASFAFKWICGEGERTTWGIIKGTPTTLKAGPIQLCTFDIQGPDCV